MILIVLVTVIGIPLGLVALLMYIILFYISKIFVAVAVGDLLMKKFTGSEKRSQAVALLIGLVLLTILFEIPFLGWILYFATVCIGLGAILIAFNDRRKAIAAEALAE